MQPEPATASNRFSGQGTNRSFYLPRLTRESYQGDAVIHWTMPMALRGTGWLTDQFHFQFREIMLHTAAREGLFCPAYCLMADHDALSPSPRQSGERAGVRGSYPADA